MSKFTLAEWNEKIAEEVRIAREENRGLVFQKATDSDRRTVRLSTTVYRFEFPKNLSDKQKIRLFNRLYMDCYRNIKRKNDVTMIALLGLSRHRKWAPFAEVTTEKGGRPRKVFNSMPSYQRPLHIHFEIMGKHARSYAERVFKNNSRHFGKWKSFKDCVFSKHTLQPLYIEWQCDPYYSFGGNIEDFIVDEDLLDFT